jgi:iron complex outermembrane receptor protein
LTGEADLSEVDLANVARVSVVPGARAARYGSGALAGAILIETRRAGASSLRARFETGSLATWAVGGAANLTPAGSSWHWALGGEWNRTAGDFEYPVPDVRGGGVAIRENAEARWASGYLETTWEPREGPRLRLRIHGRDAERGSPGTIVQPSETGRNEESRYGAVLQGDGGSPVAGWSTSVGADRTDALVHDPSPPFGEAYRADSRVVRVEGRAEARLAALGLRWGMGLDGRGWDIESTTLAPDAPGRVVGGGGWARAEWRAGGPGGAVEVGAGLRGDVHDFLEGLVLSPSVSVLLSRAGTALEAGVGRSVSPPDVSDLFFQEGVLAQPNPGLAPERVRSEVGLELRQTVQGAGWTGVLGVAAYQAHVDGMILWFPDFRFIWSPRNVDVRRSGLEASTELQAGALTFLRGDVGWTRVEYANQALDGQVVYRPELTADLAASLALGGFDWSARWRWVGERRTSPGTELNSLPSYGRLDAAVAWPFRLDALGGSLELAVQNLLDEPAALLVDYPLPGRTLTLRIRAGPPGG